MDKRKYSDELAVIANQNTKERDYWLARLAGPVKSNFPYDYRLTGEDKAEQHLFRFPGELFEKSMKLSGGTDLKFHMILAAGLMVLLAKYTGNTDIIIGSPILKQETDIPFVNTLLLFRNRVEKQMTFKQLLPEVKNTIVDASENQNYPMEVLFDRLKLPTKENESPLFDVALLLENLHDKSYIEDTGRGMTFSFVRTGQYAEGEIEYDPRLYRRGTVERIAGHFTRVLDAVLSDVNMPLARIDMLSEKEKSLILNVFNRPLAGASESMHTQTLHRAFEVRVDKSPHTIAIVCSRDNQQITYRALNETANHMACLLREKGVKADDIVALYVEPSIEMMVGELGILKAGGAYLPLALDAPRQRIRFMLQDSGTKILVSKECEVSGVGESIEVIGVISAMGKSPLERDVCEADGVCQLAYIIYTSGTTGQPKGVMVEHRQVMAYLNAFYKEFDITPKDTVIQLASYAFDVFIEEVYSPLLKGGKILIPGVDELMDIAQLTGLIGKHRVSIVDCTPLLLNEFNKQAPGFLSGVRLFINGGDTLKGEYITNLSKTGTVYNTYGPTETTVCAAFHRCTDPPGEPVPIGKPISGYSIYILDENFSLQPVGAAGELCISGPGVTRGYLNNPPLTSARFCLRRPGAPRRGEPICGGPVIVCSNHSFPPAPRLKSSVIQKFCGGPGGGFSKEPPGRRRHVYRTGDMACWLVDGGIRFLGRNDRQVKIRGYRIETGEIEGRLLEISGIKEAVVIVRENSGGEKYLCAYVVSEGTAEKDSHGLAAELRGYLLEGLPDYMVPSFFVPMDRFPLTAGKKLDRKALPEPEVSAAAVYVEPQNEVEEGIQKIWEGIFAKSPIGVNDNFFELGGHSLSGIRMVNEIHEKFNVKVPLVEIFKILTIRGIAGYVSAAAKTEFIDIGALEKAEYYEVSYYQKRLWILYQVEPDSVIYNIPGVIPLPYDIDEKALEQVLFQVMQRHESFRTSFKQVAGEPVQYIGKNLPVPLKIVDLSDVDMTEEKREQRKREIYAEHYQRPFKLESAPLFRAVLLKLAPGSYEFLFNFHHIVFDGVSFEILTKDFFVFYGANRTGTVPGLEPLKLQYKDFASWQNRRIADPAIKEKSHRFWNKKFERGIPVLQLPADYTSGPGDRRGAAYYSGVPGKVKGPLKEIAAANNTTLFMVLFAAYNIMLSHLTGQRDITAGIISSGREHFALQDIIGYFVSSVIFKIPVDPEEDFNTFLQRVNDDVLETFKHQDYPLELVFDELKMPYPDITVSFNMVNVNATVNTPENPGEVETGNMESYHAELSQGVKFDLTLHATELKDGIRISWTYKKACFKPQTIETIANGYFKLLEYITAD